MVYLNGEKLGLYLVAQKVEESKNRLNIGDDGYLLEIDQLERLDEGDVYFYSDHFLLNIKEPDLEEGSDKVDFVKDYINTFENALFSSNFTSPTYGYRKYIDVESVVDRYLINEIAKNVDAAWFASIFMHIIPGEKLKFGPIWDFDLGFGNVNYADAEYPEGFWVKANPWIDRMMKDPYFVSLVKERYSYFRNHQNHLFDKMDLDVAYISQAIEENNDIWQTFGEWVWPNAVVYETHAQEVEYLKSWITERLAWMDSGINSL